ncbi:BA14K family protein [Rhizobium grahamii]|uniref:Lectin-like protein BA14k n=1 Tax=Rhizobium grahamii TaxID=1120045 RepID=A0A5Q0C112_9HYPH|nr:MULTISPECIES: BA14K family protein [Rhizobium]QFY59252.1 BA14K family protein [Rhizobium grahamii]QRM48223.1 BA14K family protein [Rhizobium sp. BG6]
MISRLRKMAVAISASMMLFAGVLPTQAMQMPGAPETGKTDVQNVQYCAYGRCARPGYRPGYGPGYRPGYYPGYRPAYRPGYYPGYRPAYRPGWYGGYRGYPYYRNGYRYYNGYWFPLAAFGAGAVIGGAIASEPRYAPAPEGDSAHVAWCEARYRSYRAYDNTFQPNSGPRRQCVSPY